MSLERQQIERQFSRAATTYEEVSEIQRNMADRLIGRIPKSATGTLVDFGCGTGRSLDKLAARTSLRLVGIDLAKGMIDEAQRGLQARGLQARGLRDHPDTRLLVGNLERTGLAKSSASFAFSNAAIQWCDSRAAFAEMARVLQPGGRLLVSTFGPKNADRVEEGVESDRRYE